MLSAGKEEQDKCHKEFHIGVFNRGDARVTGISPRIAAGDYSLLHEYWTDICNVSVHM